MLVQCTWALLQQLSCSPIRRVDSWSVVDKYCNSLLPHFDSRLSLLDKIILNELFISSLCCVCSDQLLVEHISLWDIRTCSTKKISITTSLQHTIKCTCTCISVAYFTRMANLGQWEWVNLVFFLIGYYFICAYTYMPFVKIKLAEIERDEKPHVDAKIHNWTSCLCTEWYIDR